MSGARGALLGVVVLAALAAGGYMAARLETPAPEAVTMLATVPDCDPAAGGCIAEGAHLRLKVDFDRAASPLKPFSVRLTADRPLDDVRLRFDMVGMDMGVNTYRMQAVEGGWEAAVMLPVCVTGRRDWIMTVTAVGGDTTYRAEIPFVTH